MADAMMVEAGPNERELLALIQSVHAPDPAGLERAWERLDSLTKPPRSLGKLEEVAARLACAQSTVRPVATPSAVVLCAGDHGVVAEGVSAWPSSVTLEMVRNFVAGGAAINQLARHVGARLVLLDVGVAGDTSELPGVVQAKVLAGTRNLAVESAMTREEAARAVLAGARVARDLAAEGVRVVGTGEMGIGNTTPATALVAAFTGERVARLVGRGTGIADDALTRKIDVIERALELHGLDRGDPLGTLARLGGLEIAAMAGLFIGGASAGAAVVSDGAISAAAAIVAVRLCPNCTSYLFASHRSLEPAHSVALALLGLEPLIEFDMRLGEGTGAALAIGIMDGACAVMNGMATFSEAGVSDRDDG